MTFTEDLCLLYGGTIIMTVYREILRLFFHLHLNSSDIAKACHVIQNHSQNQRERTAELLNSADLLTA